MHIIIECPFCQRRFQVDSSLRGRQLRCPNAECREVFEVREVAPPPEPVIEGVALPSPPPSQKTGQVGDMVPVVGAEVAPGSQEGRPADGSWRAEAPPARKPPGEGPPPAAPAPAAAPDWRQAPPPSRAGDGPPARTEPAPRPAAAAPTIRGRAARPSGPRPAAPPAARAEEPPPRRKAPRASKERRDEESASSTTPVELPPGDWEPPPVRRGAGAATAPTDRRRTALEMEAAAHARKRRNKGLILVVVGLPLLLLLGGGGLALYFLAEGEDRERANAEQLYAGGLFDSASAAYGKLAEKYPDSPRRDDYRFLQELSAVRGLPSHLDTRGAFDQVSTFLKEHKDDPRLAEHGPEVGEALGQLVIEAGGKAADNVGDPDAQARFRRGLEVVNDLAALNPDWVPKEKFAQIAGSKAGIEERIQKDRDRQDLLARLRALAERPSAEAVRQMLALLRAEEARGSGLHQDPDVKKAENELYDRHRASVVFTEDEEPVPAGRRGEDVGPGLLVQPAVVPVADATELAADRVVFALARGVLYALQQSNGEIRWAMRVGIDTAHLPLRVPPSGSTPELALVLSADTLTLTAVNARTNETLWRHRLGAASLGRPVIVDRRVYIPTLNGEVHEVELAGGNLLGRYKLGPTLSVGGTRFGDSKQIFFPGDASCVYVLDVASRSCQTILYTDHAAGSLRGEPILLPSEEDPAVPGYLVLSQAHGLDATLLRTFRLLPPDPGAAPGAREARLRADPVAMPERRLRGWPWFPPYRDPEKLVTVTDAGVMGLFGIVQAHNKDDAIFPLVRVPGQEEGTVELTGHGTTRGRAQVVYGRGDDFWVLARGRLLHYVKVLDEKTGPRVVPDPKWTQPLDLGSPLHESQTDDDGRTLFLVTQSPGGQACLATAVDADSGRIRWQRQLGLVCHGDPQKMGEAVVALDQGGGLFLFDPARHPADVDEPWQSAGAKLAGPLSEGSAGSIYLVPGPDGGSVYEFACPEPGKRVIVRKAPNRPGEVPEQVIEVQARLAGTPAVGEKRVLIPLADGGTRVMRLPLGSGAPLDGPTWRASRGDTAARGHVVWLGGDDFLITNGRQGLTRYHFHDGDLYDVLPEGRSPAKPTLELPERVAGTPVVLARAGGATPLRVCVADDRGTVHLFEGDELRPARRWELNEPITAGPFARDGRVGCVLGRRRLVWLDPAKDGPLWVHESTGEGIVGQPQLADGMVLVADVSGRFVGLDPTTGLARGPGYQLRASVSPAAAPVGFGAGRAFAPLTDGTVLLLPLHPMREPLPGLPPLW